MNLSEVGAVWSVVTEPHRSFYLYCMRMMKVYFLRAGMNDDLSACRAMYDADQPGDLIYRSLAGI